MSAPIKQWWDHGISVCVWQNEKGKSISIEKKIKKDAGSETLFKGNLFVNEAPALSEMLSAAYQFCTEQHKEA